MAILVILYFILGYWATGKTIYRNYVLLGTMKDIVMQRLAMGIFLGWILIPIAVIMKLLGK